MNKYYHFIEWVELQVVLFQRILVTTRPQPIVPEYSQLPPTKKSYHISKSLQCSDRTLTGTTLVNVVS